MKRAVTLSHIVALIPIMGGSLQIEGYYFLIQYDLHQDLILFCKQNIFKKKTHWINTQSIVQQWFLLANYRLKVISSTHRR